MICEGMIDVFREVFSRVFRENPELCGAKRSFLPFLCIAKRVAGHGVNSNIQCMEIQYR